MFISPPGSMPFFFIKQEHQNTVFLSSLLPLKKSFPLPFLSRDFLLVSQKTLAFGQ